MPGPIARLDLIRQDARGVIGTLAHSDKGTVALTARHLLEPFETPEGVVEGLQLIGMLPFAPAHMVGGWPAQGGCADPDRLLGHSAYRFWANGSAPGIVTALHGALRLRHPDSQKPFVCTDVIEVTFDQTRVSGPEVDRTRNKMPPLGAMDAGSLVVTRDGTAVGIIVAGREHQALVAPLRPFLERHGLTLGVSPALMQEFDAPLVPDERAVQKLARTSWVDDLAREESCDLGPMPEAA